jgi:hypothetical protein
MSTKTVSVAEIYERLSPRMQERLRIMDGQNKDVMIV